LREEAGHVGGEQRLGGDGGTGDQAEPSALVLSARGASGAEADKNGIEKDRNSTHRTPRIPALRARQGKSSRAARSCIPRLERRRGRGIAKPLPIETRERLALLAGVLSAVCVGPGTPGGRRLFLIAARLIAEWGAMSASMRRSGGRAASALCDRAHKGRFGGGPSPGHADGIPPLAHVP
jgi:hypothetical protein